MALLMPNLSGEYSRNPVASSSLQRTYIQIISMGLRTLTRTSIYLPIAS